MKRSLWHIPAIIALCLIAYANSLSGALVWDDETQVGRNPVIRDLSTIPSQFTQAVWDFFAKDAALPNNFYRPLQTVSYTVSYAIGELSPTPYHVANLTFHTLASIAAYAVFLELGFSAMLAFLGAALFAVHPVHTEAVDWIAAIPELLCGFFYFAALWSFLKSKAGQHRAWWIASAVLFLLSLLSKEMAITLPVLIFVLSYRPAAPKLTLQQRITMLIPHALAIAVYLAMRIHALGVIAVRANTAQASILDWISLGFLALGNYLRLTLAPYPLIAYHMIPVRLANRPGTSLAAIAIISALAYLAWGYRKRNPDLFLWSIAFPVMLLPVFNFAGITSSFVSERYAYIPSLAIIAIVLLLIQNAKPQTWLWAGFAVVAIFTLMTFVRNRDWSSAENLYNATLEKEPQAAAFHLGLVDILLKRDDDRNAIYHLDTAARQYADNIYYQAPYDVYRVHIALAAVLLRQGRFEDAIVNLNKAAQINPKGEWPLVYGGAIRMAREQDDNGAAAMLQQALRINPENDTAHDYLGTAYFNLGQIPQAHAEFQQALRINPANKTAQEHYALTSQKLSGKQ